MPIVLERFGESTLMSVIKFGEFLSMEEITVDEKANPQSLSDKTNIKLKFYTTLNNNL